MEKSIDEKQTPAFELRWTPLIVPLLALLIACDTFLIGWTILAIY